MRLEQGRERNPSDQVLDALARVLQLGTEATQHLHGFPRRFAAQRQHRAIDLPGTQDP
nr:hypothetical protein [Planotetraspora silvatica]